jgi:hypothetical protein
LSANTANSRAVASRALRGIWLVARKARNHHLRPHA